MKYSIWMLLRFLVPMLSMVAGATYYTGYRWANSVPLGHPARPWLWILAITLWVFPITRFILFRYAEHGWLQNIAFFLIGVAGTQFLLLLVGQLLNALLPLAGLALPKIWPLLIFGISIIACLAGLAQALQPATVRRIEIKSSQLPTEFDGLKIVQISDLHVDNIYDRQRVSGIVDQALAEKPDLIAVTGDMVDGLPSKLRDEIAPLALLKAPLGIYYVTGNHEYYWDVNGWLKEFADIGFHNLTNAHQLIEYRGRKLLIVGFNDPTANQMDKGQGPNLEKAMANAPQADYVISLAHQPQVHTFAEAAGSDLFLTGHTHGGQFWPFPPVVSLFHKYFKGLYQHNSKMQVYVHTGSGFWGPPNRLGVPPELAVLTLKRT